MSRLIDAEALTEKLKEWLKDKETSRGRGTAEEIWCNDAEIDILDAIIEDISRMPTIEAKPIIHAKWVSNKIPGSILSGCSHCNFSCGAYSHKYCPYCGAKMDGEENESS